jgi:transcriptional regulator with XRE-family HTH domain
MQRGWVASPHYRTIVETLKAARADRQVSQRELARRLGKPPSFVNKIEQLERRLDVLEFIAIANAIGIKPGPLLKAVLENLPADVDL